MNPYIKYTPYQLSASDSIVRDQKQADIWIEVLEHITKAQELVGDMIGQEELHDLLGNAENIADTEWRKLARDIEKEGKKLKRRLS